MSNIVKENFKVKDISQFYLTYPNPRPGYTIVGGYDYTNQVPISSTSSCTPLIVPKSMFPHENFITTLKPCF